MITEDVEYRITILCNCGGEHSSFDEWVDCPLASVPVNDPSNPRHVEFDRAVYGTMYGTPA